MVFIKILYQYLVLYISVVFTGTSKNVLIMFMVQGAEGGVLRWRTTGTHRVNLKLCAAEPAAKTGNVAYAMAVVHYSV